MKAMGAKLGTSYEELPEEMYNMDDLELKLWSVIIDDIAMYKLATKNAERIGSMRSSSTSFSTAKRFSLSTLTTGIAGGGYEFRGVRKLVINGANRVTDIGLKVMAESCTTLQELDIGNCPRVTDYGLRAVAVHCPGLRKLVVDNDRKIQGPGLAAIGETCFRLEELSMAGLSHMQNWVLERISAGAPRLKTLNVNKVRKVDDTLLKALTWKCRELVNLDLGYCKQVRGGKPPAPPSTAPSAVLLTPLPCLLFLLTLLHVPD